MVNTDHQGNLVMGESCQHYVLKLLNLGKIVLFVGILKEKKTLWRQKKNKIG